MATAMDDILAKARKKASSNYKDRTAKPQPGKSVWRVLPGWNADEPNMFFRAFGQHFVKDLSGDLKAIVVCPNKTDDEPCDVCDMVTEAMQAAPDDDIRNKIGESRASQRFLLNALHVDGGESEKVQILEVGSGVFSQIVEALGEYENLIDPEKGQDIIINREGQGLNTKYTVTVRSAEKSKTVPKSALMKLYDLDEYVVQEQEAKMKKAMETLRLAKGDMPDTAGLLTSSKEVDDEIDDEIPDDMGGGDKKSAGSALDDSEIEDAEIVEDDDAADEVADELGDDISDENIDDILKGI